MENKPKSGTAIASLILGIVSFIPLVGVLLGILATILGAVALSSIEKQSVGGKGLATTGIVLGILGICFTIVVYGSIFYFGFGSHSGPWDSVKKQMSQQILMQDSGMLELYKKKTGRYPQSLEEARKAGFQVFGSDHSLKPFHYTVSADGQSYELSSLGPDGVFGTADDIVPAQLSAPQGESEK